MRMAVYGRKIAEYLRGLDPGILGLTIPPSIERISRLQLGESNLNYLIETETKRFVFRINMDPSAMRKSRREYSILRSLSEFAIAPKAFHLNESKKLFGETFLILEYVEGEPLSTVEHEAISNRSVDMLARLVARIHSLHLRGNLSNLPKRGTSYQSWGSNIRRDLRYIRRMRKSRLAGNDRLDGILKEGFSRIEQYAQRNSPPNIATPAHGDVCAQNVLVESTGSLRLIDWENFALWDPAAEVALILEGFGLQFSPSQEERFLGEYLGTRNDETLPDRLGIFRPLARFEQLVWGVKHILEISEGEMDEAFIEATDMSSHLSYARTCLKRCAASGLIHLNRGEAASLEIP